MYFISILFVNGNQWTVLWKQAGSAYVIISRSEDGSVDISE